MTAERRPTEAELKALKIAAHRQLRRWNTHDHRGALHRPERRDALRRSVQWLDDDSPRTRPASS